MNCPECGTPDAQQLFVSYLCTNDTCGNYDARLSHEAREKQLRAEEKWIIEDLRKQETDRGIRWAENLQKEIIDKVADSLKAGILRQLYSSSKDNRESQLQMEMAIAKMMNDNEQKILQDSAQMELEKIRHATQMQMIKMKHDLATMDREKEEDPLDKAMQDYLKRKLQIGMIKELNCDDW